MERTVERERRKRGLWDQDSKWSFIESENSKRKGILCPQISWPISISDVSFFPLNVYSLGLPYSHPQRGQVWREYLGIPEGYMEF